MAHPAITLAWRAGVNHVELVPVRCAVFQGVSLVELKRVTGLRRNVNAYHLEACSVIAHPRATSAAKQV